MVSTGMLRWSTPWATSSLASDPLRACLDWRAQIDRGPTELCGAAPLKSVV